MKKVLNTRTGSVRIYHKIWLDTRNSCFYTPLSNYLVLAKTPGNAFQPHRFTMPEKVGDTYYLLVKLREGFEFTI